MKRPVLLVLAMLLGCGESVTSAVIVIRSELPAGAIEQLEVRVSRGTEAPQVRVVRVGPGGVDYPVRVPLVHEDGPLGPIRVAVLGTGAMTVSGGADPFYFLEGEQLTIPITLTAGCLGVSCPAGERCVEGACQQEVVPDAGPMDGGPMTTDLGPPDLGPPDMLMCVEGCPCGRLHTECIGAHCDCEGGCTCEFYCGPGETCGELHCKDVGSECTVSAEDAADVTVNCDDAQCDSVNVRGVSNALVTCKKDNGCCIVDCTGASNCFVDCQDGAYCRVDCTGATNCGFTGEGDCWVEEPGVLDCGSNVQVCGAVSCPPDDACYPGTDGG